MASAKAVEALSKLLKVSWRKSNHGVFGIADGYPLPGIFPLEHSPGYRALLWRGELSTTETLDDAKMAILRAYLGCPT